MNGLRSGLAIIAGIAILLSFALVLTRPLRRADALGGRIEITVLHWGDHHEDRIAEDLKRSFEAANPHVRINRINASANYFAKLQTMMAAGDPPDVMFLNSPHIPKYADLDLLLDIEPFLERDAAAGIGELDPEDFYDEALNSFRYDGNTTGQGKLYGLPMSFTPLGFYYNKELFDEARLAYPTDDWTWDEFEIKAKAVAALENRYGAEFSVNVANLRVMLWTFGLELFEPGFTDVRIEEPEVQAVIERLRAWRFDHARMLVSAKSQVESGMDLFASGRVGMYGPVGRWMTPNFRKIADFDWDFAQLPRGTERKNMLYVAAWCVASGSDHPEEAWAVARHFATPEGQRVNSAPGLALPTLKSVAQTDAFLNPELKPSRDDLFLLAVERSRAMQWPAESQFTTRLHDRLQETLRLGTMSVPDLVTTIRRDWNDAMASPLRGSNFPLMPWRAIAFIILIPAAIGISAGIWGWWFRRPGRMAAREENAGLMFVAPWFIGFVAFILGPMVVSLLLAFSKWSGITTLDYAQWVGWGNFKQMLVYDERLRTSLFVTVYYVFLHVPSGQLAALGAALLMYRSSRLIDFFRSAWYLPSVLAGVGIAVLWRWVFDGKHGLLNIAMEPFLNIFGVDAPEWFGEDAKYFGVPAFAIMALWNVGAGMMIYIAGLHAIPKTLYEASEIDGAGAWKRFISVTLPMLSPVIFFNFIIAIIGSFQVFTQAYVMTRGEPADRTLFYVLYLYKQAFEYHEMGYASAMAWVLFLIVLVLTIVVMRGSRGLVHYEGMRL